MVNNLLLPCFILFFFIAILQVKGQAVDNSFKSPLTRSDFIYAMALQADGKLIIGGHVKEYSENNPSSRQIIRLHPDGSFDGTFNPGTGFNGEIWAITIQSDGKILVGGEFTTYQGKNVNKIARLNLDGTIDNSFNTGTGIDGNNNYIKSIVLQKDGKLLIGGNISSYNGKSCNLIIRLNPDGSLDESFTATEQYTGLVETIALQTDGKILLGGGIRISSDIYAPSVLIRLNTDGTMDSSFKLSSTNLYFISSVVPQEDGKILVGGNFEKYDGSQYDHLVRLHNDGTIDNSLIIGSGFYKLTGGIGCGTIGCASMIRDITLQSDGKIIVVGEFLTYNEAYTGKIVRLDSNGSLDNTFDACESESYYRENIYNVVLQPDGKIIAGGFFNEFNNYEKANKLVRFNPNPSPHIPPQANFDFISLGNEVSFIDSSSNALSYLWDFGDGNRSYVSNPIHEYSRSGNFTVTLTTSGYCGVESKIEKQLSIVSVQNVSPSKGGDSGSVTVTILGHNFTDQTLVKLVKDGKEIIGINKLSDDNGKILYVTFELYEQELGEWDLVVGNEGHSITLANSFTIESGILPHIQANIIGRDVARRGLPQRYSLSFTNNGNVDALGVPVWIAVPRHTEITFNSTILVPSPENLINFDTIDLHITVDSLFEDLPEADVYGFILRKIPANGTTSIEINATLFEAGSIYLWSTTPYFASPLKYFVGECWDFLIGEAISFIPVAGCIYNIWDIVVSPIVMYVDYEEAKRKYRIYGESDKLIENIRHKAIMTETVLIPIIDVLAKIVEGCVPAAKGIKLLDYVNKISQKKIDTFKDKNSIGNALFWKNLTSCLDFFTKKDNINKRKIDVVASMDPNEKAGPTANTEANHIRGNHALNYTVYFENVDTAEVAAQEVIIVDTLDTDLLDISTFSLGNMSFGDTTTIVPPPGLQAYATSVDLRPGLDLIVRVDAKLDTASGVVRWRFLSLDPETMELTDDPILGFLPPNVNAPDGEGNVTYSIEPFPILSSGTEIRNKATIIFDVNEPIVTNEFVNTIDKEVPNSGVSPLEDAQTDTTFTVSWSGMDAGAGVRAYDVYRSVNNGNFELWLYDVSSTEAPFIGQNDSTYSFYSIAKDYAGNIEGEKSQAETTTRIAIVTGIEDEVIPPIKIYPNPSFDQVYVDVPNPSSIVKIYLVDNAGRYVLESSKNTLDVGTLPAGIYTIVIQGKGFTEKKKFIKSR